MDRKILIVDDEKNIVDIIAFNLKKEGYTVITAADGEEGVQKAMEENPDLILLDIMMPKLDGYEVCKKIREKKNTPIIMLTARAEELDKVLGLELGGALLRTCTNGSSELVSNISMSSVGMLYNAQLMKVAGENGVAAYGVILYVNFIFIAIYLGYAYGSAPIVAFNYGAGKKAELQNVLKKSLKLLLGTGIVLLSIGVLFAGVLSGLFVGYDAQLYAMTVRGLRFYAVSFLLSGFNIFGSSFFTALNNGMVSAAISFLRTVVFEVAAVLILPLFFGLDGVWCAITVAELASILITIGAFSALRKRYQYL